MEMKEEIFSTDKNNTTMAHSNREKEVQKEEHGLANDLAKAFIDTLTETNFFETLANAIACELKKIIEKKKIEELQTTQEEETNRFDKDSHRDHSSQPKDHIAAEEPTHRTNLSSTTSSQRRCSNNYIARHTEELTQKQHIFRTPKTANTAKLPKVPKHNKVNRINFTLQKARVRFKFTRLLTLNCKNIPY